MFSVLLAVLASLSLYDSSVGRFCNFCTEQTSAKDSFEGLCKCDRFCHYFQDCCTDNQHNDTLLVTSQLPSDTTHACLSAYVNPAYAALAGTTGNYFVMVASCPEKWEEPDGMSVRMQCTSNDSTALSPVTDPKTGLVYRNEYCAQCNEVDEIVGWETSLSCSSHLLLQLPQLEHLLQQDPDLLKKECKECSFTPPRITPPPPLIPEPRSCTPAISTCPMLDLPENQYQILLDQCQQGPLDPVQGTSRRGLVYRNGICAQCHRERYECLRVNTASQISCPTETNFSTSSKPGGGMTLVPDLTVTITLRSLGKGKVSVTTSEGTSATVPVTCPEGQVPVGLTCRHTMCPQGYTQSGGKCSYSSLPIPDDLVFFPRTNNSLSLNCSGEIVAPINSSYVDLGNGSIVLATEDSVFDVLDYDDYGHPLVCWDNAGPLNCSTGLIALNHSEYQVLENKSIIFQNISFEVSFYDSYQRPLVCPDHLSSGNQSSTFTILPELAGIKELSIVGFSFTVFGTFLLLLTYSLFKDLRTLPGLILMNLCVTILFNGIIYTFGNIIISIYTLPIICTILAVLLHFTYLTQFAWMSIFSWEIMRTFYRARTMIQESRQAKTKLFIIYVIIAWIAPTLVITVALTLNYTTESMVRYGVRTENEPNFCWINHYDSMIALFLTPLAVSLFINLLTFAMTTVLLCLAQRDHARTKGSSNVTLAIVRVWLAAFLTSGISWILGFVTNSPTSWVWYPFVLLISTQGFAISLTFLLTRKVVNSYLNLFGCHNLKDNVHVLKKRLTGTLHVSDITDDKTTGTTSTTAKSNNSIYSKTQVHQITTSQA